MHLFQVHNVFILPDYYTDSFFFPHAILRCNSYTWFTQCDSTWFFVHIVFLLIHESFLHATDSYTWFVFHMWFWHVIVCFHMWIRHMIHLILHAILAHDSLIFTCDSEMWFIHMIYTILTWFICLCVFFVSFMFLHVIFLHANDSFITWFLQHVTFLCNYYVTMKWLIYFFNKWYYNLI